METGAVSPFVAGHLANAGAEPVLIDAGEVRKKARSKRQKSDRRDAFEICDGLRRDVYVSKIDLPNAATQALRETLLSRRHFVRIKTQEVNAVKGLLRKHGLARLYRALKTDAAFERLLKSPMIDEALMCHIKFHHEVWRSANAQVEALDLRLNEMASVHVDTLNRLQTVPGVGPIVALTTMAYLSQAGRFSSARQAASYTGLVPQTYNSGDRDSYGHITRRGPRELRAMLVESAHNARRRDHPLHSFYWRIAAKKGPRVAVVAVAHRLARILWAMLHTNQSFDSAKVAA
jgi:transposase